MLLNVGGLGGTLHWAAAINQSYHPSPIPIPSPSPSTLVPAAGNLPICHKAQAIMSRRRACKCCQRHVAAAIAIRCAPVHVQGPVNGCAMAITAKPSNLKRHTPWRPGPASPAIRCPSLRNGPPAGKARSLACARMHTLDSQSRERVTTGSCCARLGQWLAECRLPQAHNRVSPSLPGKVCAENEILPDVAHPIPSKPTFLFSFCLSLICPALPYPALPCVLLPSSPLAFPLSANV